jgi:hypothetical protein
MGLGTRVIGKWFLGILTAGLLLARSAEAQPTNSLSDGHSSVWADGVGSGFRKGTVELDVGAGAGLGIVVLTGVGEHHWVNGIVDYGWIFSDVVGKGHWYRGNWELLADLFGGYQFSPEGAYFIGLSPHIRYNFATGSRFIPFIDFGAGATATDIREPDLSTTFEFNLQGGGGLHYFLRDDLALTFQWRFIHFSNAGIKFPNTGVNNSTFLLGLSWFW